MTLNSECICVFWKVKLYVNDQTFGLTFQINFVANNLSTLPKYANEFDTSPKISLRSGLDSAF